MVVDLRISQLISSNESPSDGTILEIKELLAKPLQELSKTNTEIENIEKILEALREKQIATQTLIDSYNTILSPARRIPPDVLREIFLHCLPTVRNPIMSDTEAPLLLTRVCSAWRSIALTSPHIWAKLYIPFPGSFQDLHPLYGVFSTANVMYAQLMQMRCKMVKEWLSRSGTCPLSISINFGSGFDAIEESWVQHTENLFDVVIEFSDRWMELELSLPFDMYERFQAKIAMDRIPGLKILRASLSEHERDSPSSRPIPLLTAPFLTCLSLSVLGDTLNISQMPHIWHRLAYLSLHSPIPDRDTLDLLKACHNLIDCRLLIISRWNESISYDASSSGMAVLPHLQSLSISEDGFATIMGAIFRAIVTPSLKWLEYNKNSFFSYGGELATQVSPFIHLVEGSAATLTKLTFQTRGISGTDVLKCLKLPTRLRHLAIGEEPTFLESGPGVPLEYVPHLQPLSQDTFGLDPLIVPVPAESGHDDGGDQEILLPHLEVFEAYQISSISDESLARFICSRLQCVTKLRLEAKASSSSSSLSPVLTSLTPPLINGIATLRKVIVQFDRLRQLDIAQQVQDAANKAGVPEFVLKLYYLPERPKRLEPFSPAFGLNEKGLSWSRSNLEVRNVLYDV